MVKQSFIGKLLVSRLQSKDLWIRARSSVRPCTRDAIRKPRIRFCDFFTQSYIMMSLKKCSDFCRFLKKFSFSRFRLKMVNLIFGHFCSKIRLLDIFFETTHQIYLKLGQKLGENALNHLMTVLCLGKFILWLFWLIFGQKCIACGDKMELTIFCQYFYVPWPCFVFEQ